MYFENTGSARSSIIGHNFMKLGGSKTEVRKKCFYKKWSPKLIFLNDFFEKIPSIFDIKIDFESTIHRRII